MRTTIMAAMAALSLAGAAHATEEILTVTGTVASGYDPTGTVFETPTPDLAGYGFTAVVAYNGADIPPSLTPGYAEASFGNNPSYDFFSFTINGYDDSFRRGPIGGDVEASGPPQPVNEFWISAIRDQYQGFGANLYGLPSAAYLDKPFSVSGSDIGTGFYADTRGINGIDLTLAVDSVALAQSDAVFPSPIAEPATWAVMLVGFGLAGVSLRRHRSLHPLV